jgi:hypothetical protein
MKKDIRVDARGHVSLLGLRKEGDSAWYFGHRDPDGTIHLVPAMLVPAKLKAETLGGLDVLSASREELHERA